MTRILVTGANGFVGQTLCEVLASHNFSVRAAVRRDYDLPAYVSDKVVTGDIGSHTNWTDALGDVDCVIHVAARAHMKPKEGDTDVYDEINAKGTERLAHAAAREGVSRFIYLSSVKVNGEQTDEHVYRATDTPRPHDAYARSKWQAEQSLRTLAANTALEIIVVRPPLVYGPRVRANFLRLLRWVDSGWPLPLGSIVNRRSLVSVWNLCSLLTHFVTSRNAVGHTWMVSDGEDLSTPELIRRIALAMDRRVRLVPIPMPILRAVGLVAHAQVSRLCGSLMVDASSTFQKLDWTPPLSVNEGLARTVDWYLSEGRSL